MSTYNRTSLGIFLFVGAVSINAVKDGISKLLSAEITPVTFLSIQYMFLVILLSIPITLYFGRSALIPPRPWLQLLRGGSACLGIGFYYWSVHFIHIADAIAVVFVSPLIVTTLSPLLLGERPLGARRIMAVLVGFIGVIIIVQPSFTGQTPGYLIALGSGFFISFFYLLNRKLSQESPLICSVFHTALCASFFLLPLLFFLRKSDTSITATPISKFCDFFCNWPNWNDCGLQTSCGKYHFSIYICSNNCCDSCWILSFRRHSRQNDVVWYLDNRRCRNLYRASGNKT